MVLLFSTDLKSWLILDTWCLSTAEADPYQKIRKTHRHFDELTEDRIRHRLNRYQYKINAGRRPIRLACDIELWMGRELNVLGDMEAVLENIREEYV